MPIIIITYSNTIKGFTFSMPYCTASINKGLLAIPVLGLKNEDQITIKYIKSDGNDNSVIATVLLDKKPERDKKILDKIAQIIQQAIQNMSEVVVATSLIEVFVTPFDHSTGGFSTNEHQK